MNDGRWYPTAVTLPDGSVLVSSGSIHLNQQNNVVQQIWTIESNKWRNIVTYNDIPLYPRMHVAPNGQVFMSGPNSLTQFLDTSAMGGFGQWNRVGDRDFALRDYAPSVVYDDRKNALTDAGKIIYIGGGVGPTNAAMTIDLNAATPVWKPANSMKFKRRQHNATILPDGTVLVTGGTQGSGSVGGFDDLAIGSPIRAAELWNPKTGTWTVLAEESVDRCYHSTAILLPDATVLSAGGGEYRPDPSMPAENPLKDSHRDAQIYSPPYLFRGGQRPAIGSAPDTVVYATDFDVVTAQASDIADVTWIRLSSVTHSFNQNQRINFLKFVRGVDKLRVTPPANANACPPGHYMLFLIDKKGVPSIAKIMKISS
jgi:galactose oxidase